MSPTPDWGAFRQRLDRIPERERREALARLRRRFLGHDTRSQESEMLPWGDYLSDPASVAAYEEWFFPQSFAKAASVLEELSAQAVVNRVVDLGSGMGPLAFAALQRYPSATAQLFDRSKIALESAREIARLWGHKIITQEHDFAGGLPAFALADLIVVGNFFSELSAGQAALFADELLQRRLRPLGYLVIVEPADRVHARGLQAMRDSLLPAAPARPCPHAAPCPASYRERDFCHQARDLKMPHFWSSVFKELGMSETRQTFSYLVYGGATASPATSSPVIRLISDPLKEKGRLRFLACSQAGPLELVRQDRFKSEKNSPFDDLVRGDAVTLSGPLSGPSKSSFGTVIKLSPEDVVTRL